MDLSGFFQGKGTEFGSIGLVLWALFFLHKLGVFKKIKFVIKITNRMNNNKAVETETAGNPNNKPGKADECLKHMKAIAILNTEVKNDKNQNQIDHERIDKKCDRIFILLDKKKNE